MSIVHKNKRVCVYMLKCFCLWDASSRNQHTVLLQISGGMCASVQARMLQFLHIEDASIMPCLPGLFVSVHAYAYVCQGVCLCAYMYYLTVAITSVMQFIPCVFVLVGIILSVDCGWWLHSAVRPRGVSEHSCARVHMCVFERFILQLASLMYWQSSGHCPWF